MTNQEQYEHICEAANKVFDMADELKILREKLDRTEKQRNALMIALNYVKDTMIAMKWGANAHPDDMERIVNNALIMATEKSKGTIKMEVKEDDI